MSKNHGADRSALLEFAAEHYHVQPEYLFRRSPQTFVLRHPNNRKWFAIVMPVPREKLGLSGGISDVLNVKCDPLMTGSLCLQKGFFPAYHMNKNGWVSILLDGTLAPETVFSALQMSFALIDGKQGGGQRITPKEWLIPSNPKYILLRDLFAREPETLWKQSARFIPGDTVYLYEGKPVGAVTYAAEVTAVDIPFHLEQDWLWMETAMRIRVRAALPQESFPLERLRDFGVRSLRGPRGIPADLLAAMQAAEIPF